MQSYWTARSFARQRAIVSVLCALLATLAVPANAGQISGVLIEDDRIVVRFDEQPVKATSFVLAGPNRIAIDIEGADAGPKIAGAGPIERVRQAGYATGSTRIVFDATIPFDVTGGRFSEDGRELTLDIVPISDDEIEAATGAPRRLYRPAETRLSAPPRSRYAVTVPIPPRQNTLPRPRIDGPAGRPLVVLDAGHGGHDPGASGAGAAREKDVTLALARAIREELLAGGRVRVALTRDDDRFLVLQDRAKIARALKADLFISVHADSAPAGDATGATIYTLSEIASGRTAAALAARENRADVINGVNLASETSDVSSILIDLAQRETMNASSRFADLVHREGTTLPFKRDYHQMAGFAVLKAPDTPAILLEAGYITSASDAERITSPAGRREIAVALRRAIDIQFARRIASR